MILNAVFERSANVMGSSTFIASSSSQRAQGLRTGAAPSITGAASSRTGGAPPRAGAAPASVRALFLVLALLLTLLPLLHATAQADMAISVLDADGHPVPDVLVTANYQTDGSRPALDGKAQGFTNSRGQWRATLTFPGNTTPAQYVQLSAYAPYWSSGRMQARISTKPNEELDANFTIPLFFETYRVQLISPGGPIPGAELQLVSPGFVYRRSDSNGLVQMRFPRGLPVRGWVAYSGQMAWFDFASQSDQPSGQPRQIFVRYPFENSAPAPSAGTYNLTARVSDPNDRLLFGQPFSVQTPDANLTYLTDALGYLRLLGVPYPQVNLSWTLQNITYNLTLDLTAPPDIIRTPVLLQIQPPNVFPLGESCYRVLVNITDPRLDAVEQVIAVPENATTVLPFSLDQRLTVNRSTVHFYRVLCVLDDTGFDIVAANQYENSSLRIQLRHSAALATPVASSGNAAIGVAIPKADTSKADEAKRLELIVILLELLFFLVSVYLLVRFRDLVLHYGQSIVRTVHTIYQDLRTANFRKRRIGEPPAAPPPTAS